MKRPNKIDNHGSGMQAAINTGSGNINQIITISTFGIRTELPKEVQDQIDAAEEGSDLKRVRLSDFTGPEQSIISNKTFKNLEILGPCVIYPLQNTDITIAYCSWFGSIQSVFIEVPDEWDFLQGVVGLENCHFTNCVFKNVAIMAKISDMPKLKGSFTSKS